MVSLWRSAQRRRIGWIRAIALGVVFTSFAASASAAGAETLFPAGGDFAALPLVYSTSGTCGLLCSFTTQRDGSASAGYYLQTTYNSLLGSDLLDAGTETLTSPSFTWTGGTPAAAELTLQLKTALGQLVGLNADNGLQVNLIDTTDAANDQDGLINADLDQSTSGFQTLSAVVAPSSLVDGHSYEIQVLEKMHSLLSLATSANVDVADLGLAVNANGGGTNSTLSGGSGGSGGSSSSGGSGGSSVSIGPGNEAGLGAGGLMTSTGGSFQVTSGGAHEAIASAASCRAIYTSAPRTLRGLASARAASEVTAKKAFTLRFSRRAVRDNRIAWSIDGGRPTQLMNGAIRLALSKFIGHSRLKLSVSLIGRRHGAARAARASYSVALSTARCATYESAARVGRSVMLSVRSTAGVRSASYVIPKDFGAVDGIATTVGFVSHTARIRWQSHQRLTFTVGRTIVTVRRSGNTVTVIGLPADTHTLTLQFRAPAWDASGTIHSLLTIEGSSSAEAVDVTLKPSAVTAASKVA